MAPTIACELETGTSGMVGNPWSASQASSPREANIINTIECDITAMKAAVGDSRPRSPPTVIINAARISEHPKCNGQPAKQEQLLG